MAGISIGFSEIFGQQATTSNIQIKIRTRREEGANVDSKPRANKHKKTFCSESTPHAHISVDCDFRIYLQMAAG